jgi:hypothetical protein
MAKNPAIQSRCFQALSKAIDQAEGYQTYVFYIMVPSTGEGTSEGNK